MRLPLTREFFLPAVESPEHQATRESRLERDGRWLRFSPDLQKDVSKMKYMLLIYSAERDWTEDERAACIARSTEICHELSDQGKFVSASPLHPVSSATCVRLKQGKRLVTDGPFAETTEQLGGYYIIDVENLDEAIQWAGQLPPAGKGTVEIRPIVELDNLPDPSASISTVSDSRG